MRETDNFYLDRRQQRLLIDLLHKVHDLALELEIAITNQARIGGGGYGKTSKGRLAELWPYQPDASDTADHLHATLERWLHALCEARQLTYRGNDTTPGYARWLNRHVIDLAMIDTAPKAYIEIRNAVRAAEATVCPPCAPVEINETRVEKARLETLNAHGIAIAARELGEEYRNLTERRVQVLRDAGKITPVTWVLSKHWRPSWPAQYRLGDVLDAHLRHPIRRRHIKAGSE